MQRGDDEPVLVAGRAGLGRVLVWTLPATDAGAGAWPALGRLFAQIARSALAPEGAFEYLPRPQVEQGPDGARLRVLWPPGTASGRVEARWFGPAGAERAVGTFTSEEAAAARPLPDAPAGSHCRIELQLPGGPQPAPLGYLVAAPAEEPLRAADPDALAAGLGTALVEPIAFTRELPVLERAVRVPRWPLFLWLAVLLLPLDVFLHRRGRLA